MANFQQLSVEEAANAVKRGWVVAQIDITIVRIYHHCFNYHFIITTCRLWVALFFSCSGFNKNVLTAEEKTENRVEHICFFLDKNILTAKPKSELNTFVF